MKNSRRTFLSNIPVLGLSSLAISGTLLSCKQEEPTLLPGKEGTVEKPLIISTWNNEEANGAAWKKLNESNNILDAVEAGIHVPESNPQDMSVGYGGRLDRTGKLTLDACIMDSQGRAGSVCYLKDIKHPISVARKVMEETPHVMLVGEGARKFALENGFKEEDLTTEKSRQDYEKWLEKSEYEVKINIERHDTIGLLVQGQDGNIAGGCSTSGLAYKMDGRVGDSPIIGAGLFVDNEVGAAAATGLGETVLRTLGSFLVVELMRSGMTPDEACRQAVKRVIEKNKLDEKFQVGFIAVRKDSEIGAYSVRPGFSYTLTEKGVSKKYKASSFLKK